MSDRDRYASGRSTFIQNEIERDRNGIVTIDMYLRRAIESAMSYSEQLRIAQVKSEALNKLSEERQEILRKEYDKLQHIDGIQSMRITTAEYLYATTNPIHIEYGEHTYNLGEYQIKMSLRTGILSVTSLTFPEKDYPHPHVSSINGICWGNLTSDVSRAIMLGDVYTLLTTLILFLNNVTPGEWYKHIDQWDEIEEKL